MSKTETAEKCLSGNMNIFANNLSQYIAHNTTFQIVNKQEFENKYDMEIITPKSVYSYGEYINVIIEQIEDNKCKVSIRSTLKSRLQQVDWHKNQDNIDSVLQGLNGQFDNTCQPVIPDKINNAINKNLNRCIASNTCQYYGGNENLNKVTMGTLYVYSNRISFVRFVKPNFEIPIAQIINNEVLTQEQITQRPTLTRMLMLGAFSLAVPKKETNKFTYLSIKYNNENIESNLVFKFDGYNSTSKAIKIDSAIIKARKAAAL